MTVSSSDNSVTYTGNGATVDFPFSFKVVETTHIVVTLTTIASGLESAPISSSLYAVALANSPLEGGTVTYPLSGSPLSNAYKINIYRLVPYTQEERIENSGGFLPAVVEGALDKLEMQIQQLLSEIEELQSLTILAGNVPSPGAPDTGKVLTATGVGLFSWQALTFNNVVLTGNPTAPTPSVGDNDTSVATTAFVTAAVAAALAGIQIPPTGRITLTSGSPVMSATVNNATTIYYTGYIGRTCPIFDGTNMVSTDIGGELSNITTNSSTGKAGPAVVANNSNYDLFVWNDAGTIRLTRGPAWTSDTARGTGAGTTELSRNKGILTNANTIANGPAAGYGTYVGTFRSNGTARIDWQYGVNGTPTTAGIAGFWNMYNRVAFNMNLQDTTDNWSYANNLYRAANNSATYRVSFVQGQTDEALFASYECICSPGATGRNGRVGIGYDSTTAVSSKSAEGYVKNTGMTTDFTTLVATFNRADSLGFHFVSAIESGDAAGCTFVGDNTGATAVTTGLQVWGRY